jgi:hypothetical protein
MATILSKRKDTGPISIRFNYRPELAAKIKEIKGQSWHPDTRYWTASNIEPTIELLSAVFSK